ncbi:MAG: hypothetical protein KatS3mg117_2628 [Geminicoccaceae bacterium]|nr:MAG: hypothetical protein KatS3mg117_2628 [Geminicoccaceae bacterium]
MGRSRLPTDPRVADLRGRSDGSRGGADPPPPQGQGHRGAAEPRPVATVAGCPDDPPGTSQRGLETRPPRTPLRPSPRARSRHRSEPWVTAERPWDVNAPRFRGSDPSRTYRFGIFPPARAGTSRAAVVPDRRGRAPTPRARPPALESRLLPLPAFRTPLSSSAGDADRPPGRERRRRSYDPRGAEDDVPWCRSANRNRAADPSCPNRCSLEGTGARPCSSPPRLGAAGWERKSGNPRAPLGRTRHLPELSAGCCTVDQRGPAATADREVARGPGPVPASSGITGFGPPAARAETGSKAPALNRGGKPAVVRAVPGGVRPRPGSRR